ncbi:hypothetical protein [Brevundimonas sp.]|uniref:hypothetical protein n=1 Tax=Brevundimonas sp. TaxID=1871086 RepID=UPI002EDB94E1
MHVRILRDRNWTPPEDRRMTVAYKAGWKGPVKRAWGQQLVKDGDAVEISAPARGAVAKAKP